MVSLFFYLDLELPDICKEDAPSFLEVFGGRGAGIKFIHL